MGWIACPARNHRATSNRRIEPPLEGQRHYASGGWTSHQVLRAHAAGLGPDEPTTFGLLGTHLQLLRGHGGDSADCITNRPSFMPQATEKARNGRDEQIATMDRPLRKTQPRFCSIAWFAPHKASRHNYGKNPRRILTRPTSIPLTHRASPQPLHAAFCSKH
jgi:hypothetical protein